MLQAPLACQLQAHLAEELGLQLGQVGQATAHPTGGVVLGEAVGGHHVGEDLAAGLAVGGVGAVVWAIEDLPGGVGLLAVQRVVAKVQHRCCSTEAWWKLGSDQPPLHLQAPLGL